MRSPAWDEERRDGAAEWRAAEERERVRLGMAERLRAEGAPDLARPLERCGEPVALKCVTCGDDRPAVVWCRKRWCPWCAPLISAEQTRRWSAAVRAMEWPLFVTLTRPNSPDPESVRELRAAWGRMRRRKLFAAQISGGVATVEVTNRGNGWHPHLHVIADCRWLSVTVPPPAEDDTPRTRKAKCQAAHDELAAVWSDVLKVPRAVCLAKRAGRGDVAAYVLKYACKPGEMLDAPDRIADLIRVLAKSRLVSAFGSLHGRAGLFEDDDRAAVVCSCCGDSGGFVPVDLLRMRADPIHLGRTVRPSNPSYR